MRLPIIRSDEQDYINRVAFICCVAVLVGCALLALHGIISAT
jgi:hypothetical protein